MCYDMTADIRLGHGEPKLDRVWGETAGWWPSTKVPEDYRVSALLDVEAVMGQYNDQVLTAYETVRQIKAILDDMHADVVVRE